MGTSDIGSAMAGDEIVIRPASDLLRFDVREFWRYRQMLRAMVWRNVRLQFDEMYLGVVWACLRPLLYVAVFVAFKNLSSADTRVEIPYPLYVYSGLILWYYFVESATDSAGSVKLDAYLLTKVYYPRLITPLVPVIANVVTLGIAMAPLLGMMAWYGTIPSWRILLLPIVLLQLMALSMGVGMVVAANTLSNRDWERVMSFTLYLGLFVSPVIYAPEMIPERVRALYFLNPTAGSLLAFRAALFASPTFPFWQWVYSLVCSLAVFALGVRVYRRAEAEMADHL
jgi:homopolymeric O-antigen transport system permease protein